MTLERLQIARPEELVASEEVARKRFFGETSIPNPSSELRDVLTRAKEQGITVFDPHFLPRVELKQEDEYPGWKIKPENWYWEQIRKGRIGEDAPKLDGVWVLFDKTPKPNYTDGTQMYENDPFAQILERGRKDGRIQVPDFVKHVPQNSRFAVSSDELYQYVYPEIAKLLGIDPTQVRSSKEIEFNVLGNLHYPYLGETSTWEWLHDKFEDDHRLDGGGSGLGGLANVHRSWSDDRHDDLGFRPLVVFPSKS